jgi:CheY-like chemotaxis protein
LLHEALQERPDLTPRILRALDAADRGATLTQRLLAFSRLQTLQPQMTNLNDMIRNLVDLLDYNIGNGIVIETDLQPTVDEVFVDQGQLENAIFNLIFNSRDAMPKGGKIVISVAAANADDGFVRISVKDNGFGMTPDVVARVYEPFFTTKEKGRGSGLGLSMVYGFVSQSGGQVDIASEPNGGTTVSIKLPKAKTGEPTQRWSTSAVANDTVVGGSECILVVEDDRIVRETAVDMLTSLGYRTVVAESLEQAQIELAGATFDLLFTDYILPDGMTGDDVAAHARRTWPEIVVLYTSGYPRDKLNRNMMRASNITLLAKPYRRETLAAVIRQLLDARQSKPKRSTATLKR